MPDNKVGDCSLFYHTLNWISEVMQKYEQYHYSNGFFFGIPHLEFEMKEIQLPSLKGTRCKNVNVIVRSNSRRLSNFFCCKTISSKENVAKHRVCAG